MSTHDIDVWHLCQLYVSDLPASVDEGLKRTVSGWIRSRSLEKLASCSTLLQKTLYTKENVVACLQIEAFFKKNASFTEPTTVRAAARKTFLASEARCRRVNRRFDFYALHPGRLDHELEAQLSYMRRWIGSTLGPFRDYINEIPELIQVTAGATATASRADSFPAKKLSRRMYCTRGTMALLKALGIHYGFRRDELRFRFRDVNRIEFVPKNWKTERTIACEPEGSMIFQLAFDKYVKRRMVPRGINLYDQSPNQADAYKGSIDGSIATIDLKNASDTISYNVVCDLFPHEWFTHLCSLRSKAGFNKDMGYIKYEKFSSMGNGSTFGIETLIFAAAARAVGSKVGHVYGDDITVETALYERLVRLLRFLGFRLNEDKSYHTGPYRESCGKHYFEGTEVTPFYLESNSGLKPRLCLLINSMVPRCGPGFGLLKYFAELIAQRKLLITPISEDTTCGVHLSRWAAIRLGKVKTRHGIRYFKGYSLITPRTKLKRLGAYFLWHINATYAARRSGFDAVVTSVTTKSVSHRYRAQWRTWYREVPLMGAHSWHAHRLECLLTTSES